MVSGVFGSRFSVVGFRFSGVGFRWLAAALVVLALGCPAFAADVQLSLLADTIEAEQTVSAVVSVIDYDTSVRPPSLVVPPEVEVTYAYPREGLETSGRRIVRTVSFVFQVSADEPGTYILGPADVMVDGQVVTTNPVTLTVTERTLTEDGPPVVGFARFLDTEVYEGEVVLYHYGLRSRLRIYRDQWSRPPMDRLQSPRDGLPRSAEYVVEDPTGAIVVKETWQPMLATAPGDLGQIGASAIVSVESPRSPRDRFSLRRTENITIVTDPAPLTVLPLPAPPPGFTGLVGDFDITGQLDSTRVRAGDSVTYTVNVRGDGSLEGFALPEAPEVDGARFYDNDVGADARVQDGRYVAQGRYERVVVATKAGEVQVPPMEIIAFSPTERRYVTHTLTFEPIRVRPGEDGEADVESFSPNDAPSPDAPADDDIRPVYRSVRLHGGSSAWWVLTGLVLLSLPALAVFGLAGRDRVAAWRARRPVAEAGPMERLNRIPTDSPDRLSHVDATLREVWVARQAQGPVSEARREEVQGVLSELGRVRFAGDAASADLDERAVVLIRSFASEVTT